VGFNFAPEPPGCLANVRNCVLVAEIVTLRAV
jgi:hypothetical protein